MAANVILQNVSDEELKNLNLISDLELQVLECHDNYEYRVRIAAGQLMGVMCHRQGLPMFKKFLPSVIRGVLENLDRALDAPATETESALRELIIAKVCFGWWFLSVPSQMTSWIMFFIRRSS